MTTFLTYAAIGRGYLARISLSAWLLDGYDWIVIHLATITAS